MRDYKNSTLEKSTPNSISFLWLGMAISGWLTVFYLISNVI